MVDVLVRRLLEQTDKPVVCIASVDVISLDELDPQVLRDDLEKFSVNGKVIGKINKEMNVAIIVEPVRKWLFKKELNLNATKHNFHKYEVIDIFFRNGYTIYVVTPLDRPADRILHAIALDLDGESGFVKCETLDGEYEYVSPTHLFKKDFNDIVSVKKRWDSYIVKMEGFRGSIIIKKTILFGHIYNEVGISDCYSLETLENDSVKLLAPEISKELLRDYKSLCDFVNSINYDEILTNADVDELKTTVKSIFTKAEEYGPIGYHPVKRMLFSTFVGNIINHIKTLVRTKINVSGHEITLTVDFSPVSEFINIISLEYCEFRNDLFQLIAGTFIMKGFSEGFIEEPSFEYEHFTKDVERLISTRLKSVLKYIATGNGPATIRVFQFK